MEEKYQSWQEAYELKIKAAEHLKEREPRKAERLLEKAEEIRVKYL